MLSFQMLCPEGLPWWGDWGKVTLTSQKSAYSPPPGKILPVILPIKTSVLLVAITHVPFFLTWYSFYTQVMLMLILIGVQYLQNVAFSFEKDLNGQNHFSSDSHRLIKTISQQNLLFPPYTLILFGKPWVYNVFQMQTALDTSLNLLF